MGPAWPYVGGAENAGLELGGPNSRAGKCRTGK